MPQTREHLDILRLLEVKKGLVALTKVDLVDPEWLELVRSDVAAELKGTFLEDAPIVNVSSVTGEGLDELRRQLDLLLERTESKDALALLRLPVDRIFTRPGFGTVVTGTLVAGTIRLDQRLEVLPQGVEARVRGLQVHGEKRTAAEAGERVAVNLAGVEKAELHRGDVLCQPGTLRPTQRLAGRVRVLESAARPLKHGQRLHFHTGTAEVLTRVELLDADELPPGQTGFGQFRTEAPVVVGRGDHFVIRSYSPMVTIGGGAVIEPHADYRRSRASEAVADLQAKARGSTGDLVEAAMAKAGGLPLTVPELVRRSGLAAELVRPELDRMLTAGALLRVGEDHLIHRRGLEALRSALAGYFTDYFRQYPLRAGAPREEARRKLLPGCDAKLWNPLLAMFEQQGLVRLDRDRVSPAGRQVQLSEPQRRLRDGLDERFRAAGMSPPTVAEAARGLEVRGTPTEEMVQHLVDVAQLVKVADDMYFHAEALTAAEARVRELLSGRSMTTSELREALSTSRKYVVPLLEYFDSIKLTRRVGDARVLA